MTLKETLTLFEYDAWATDRTLDSVSSVPRDRYLEDLKSSHGGIHGTLVHVYGSNMVWLHRWKGSSPSSSASAAEIADLGSLRAHWALYRTELNNYLGSLSEADITAVLTYKDLKGNPRSEPLLQQMQHLVNHSTYHRGQVVTMIRQTGSQPTATDLIMFYRTRQRTS